MQRESHDRRALIAIKLIHTVFWLFFAGCILAIPVAGLMHRFSFAAVLIGCVLIECGILAANHGRCPLTDLAGRFTTCRQDNFDIYLPPWLARRNKWIFGGIFAVGIILVFVCWAVR